MSLRVNPISDAVDHSSDTVNPRRMRDVLGHFCTGVTVITGADPLPRGFTCQSFSSLSLDPAYVMIAPGRASRSWALIRETGHFAVNILAAHQEEVSRAFGSPTGNKFDSVRWRSGITGSPILAGVTAWIDCQIVHEYEGGDHTIVVGRVLDLDTAQEPTTPLLFNRGAYSRVSERESV